MSAIEKELLEATGFKKKVGEKKQDYFDRLISAVQKLKDDAWDGLSSKAQKWVNAGAKVVNDDSGEIPDFPDKAGAKKDDEDDKPKSRRAKDDDDGDDDKGGDDDDADDKPKSRRGKSKDDDDDADDKPKSRRGAKDDDDDGEDDKPKSRRGSKDEEDDEKPARGRGRAAKDDDDGEDDKPKSRRGKKDDDDGEDDKPKGRRSKDDDDGEDDKPKSRRAKDDDDDEKPKRRGNGGDKPKKGGAQVAIKTAVIKNPKASTEDLVALLEKKGLDVTLSAVSTIRSGTLQTLRLVKDLGMPKGEF